MDRIARSAKELLTIVDNLAEKNIDLVFLEQNIDTSKAGLISARARGRKGGRPKILSDSKVDTAFKCMIAIVT
jgi:ABC-type Zn uptake system ZnuABC Zn-binding protein ZnuA